MQNPDITLPKEKQIKSYIAIIRQTGTGNPTQTILKNDLEEDCDWTRIGTGIYEGTWTNSQLTANKTTMMLGPTGGFSYISRLTENTIEIRTFDTSGILEDNQLEFQTLEIKIYI